MSMLRSIRRNNEARKNGMLNRKGAYFNIKYAEEKRIKEQNEKRSKLERIIDKVFRRKNK